MICHVKLLSQSGGAVYVQPSRDGIQASDDPTRPDREASIQFAAQPSKHLNDQHPDRLCCGVIGKM